MIFLGRPFLAVTFRSEVRKFAKQIHQIGGLGGVTCIESVLGFSKVTAPFIATTVLLSVTET